MKLSRVNTSLLIAILLVNGYIVVFPFLPALVFTRQKHSARADHITQQVAAAVPSTPIAPDAQTLLIPSMVFDETIHDGPTIRTLREGLWRLPYTSTPDMGGNTVIAAHRFTYANPRGTFYHLDQVKLGDPIAILWHGKKYNYTVTEVKQVPATQVDIEKPTADKRLTLYTCTPLWNPKDRLVVVASLKEAL